MSFSLIFFGATADGVPFEGGAATTGLGCGAEDGSGFRCLTPEAGVAEEAGEARATGGRGCGDIALAVLEVEDAALGRWTEGRLATGVATIVDEEAARERSSSMFL